MCPKPKCLYHNYASREACWSCGHARPGIEAAPRRHAGGTGKGAGGTRGKGSVGKAGGGGPLGHSGQRPLLAWYNRGTWGGGGVNGNREGQEARGEGQRGGKAQGKGELEKGGRMPMQNRQDVPQFSHMGAGNPQQRAQQQQPPTAKLLGKSSEGENAGRTGGKPANRWAVFQELEAEESNDEVAKEEDQRDREVRDDWEGEEAGGGEGEWTEAEDEGYWEQDEGQKSKLQWLQEEHEANMAMVRALQHRGKEDVGLSRAKCLAALSRNEVEEEQRAQKGPKPLHSKIATVQRKIGAVKRKLEAASNKMEEVQEAYEKQMADLQCKKQVLEDDLAQLEEQFGHHCAEVKGGQDYEGEMVQTTAEQSQQCVRGVAHVLQELLSRAGGDEDAQMLLGRALGELGEANANMEWIAVAAGGGRKATVDEWRGAEVHELSEGGSEDQPEGEARSSATGREIPARWMETGGESGGKDKGKGGRDEGKGEQQGKGEKRWLGNVAVQYHDALHAQEAAGEGSKGDTGTGDRGAGETTEASPQEIEMARKVVVRAAELCKDKPRTPELHNWVLAEASKYMAEWLLEQGKSIDGSASAKDHMANMATLQRCHRLVEEAARLLEEKRNQDAVAEAAANAAGC